MQWKVILGPAWAEAEGFSDSDLASKSLFDVDLAGARSAREGDLCPRCRNHPADSLVRLFAHEPATAPGRVEGREFVKCLCGTVYSFVAVHEMDAHQPLGEASVRAASTPRTVEPPTGTLQIDGQGVQPIVPPPSPVPPYVTHVLRSPVVWETWYGHYAQDASRIFPPVRD